MFVLAISKLFEEVRDGVEFQKLPKEEQKRLIKRYSSLMDSHWKVRLNYVTWVMELISGTPNSAT